MSTSIAEDEEPDGDPVTDLVAFALWGEKFLRYLKTLPTAQENQ